MTEFGTLELQQQLFPKRIEDNLPENELSIDRAQWDNTNEILAFRALNFFQSKGFGLEPLSSKNVPKYEEFLHFWSFPWKVHMLKTAYTQEELKLIWENCAFLLTSSLEEFELKERSIQEQLARVSPSVEADLKSRNPYNNQSDIDQALINGKLVAMSGSNIVVGQYYIDPILNTIFIENIDPQMEDVSGYLTLSSAVRALDYQKLLRKLGYPAAKSSYHNYGLAIDFRVSENERLVFQEYLKEVINTATGETRFDKITQMIAAGKQPTIENMLGEGIITENHTLARTYNLLRESVEDHPIAIIDESPFFTYTENGKVIVLNPVLHLQYMPDRRK